MANFLFLMSVFSTITSVHSLATCYYPDGTIGTEHVPCNQTITGFSACCNPLDSCSLSGICLGASGWDYRGSCTDSSWGSANCPAVEWNQCIIGKYTLKITEYTLNKADPSTKKKYDEYAPLWPCISEGEGGFIGELATDWCCAYSNGSSCCENKFTLGNTGKAFQPGYDAILQSLTSGSTNTSCPTTTVTTTPTGGASKGGKSNGNIGTKVGLGVGIPLGVLVAGLLGLLFWRESKKKHSSPASYSPTKSQPTPIYEAPQNALHEMSAR
jgi:hypothetical protein